MASGFMEGMGEAWLSCVVARVVAIVVLVAAVIVAAWVLGGRP